MTAKQLFARDWYWYLRFCVERPNYRVYELTEMQAAKAKLEAAIYDTRNLKLNVELDKLRAAIRAVKG